MEGTIKTLVQQKGYGFVNARGTDYFFHRDNFIGHWNDLIFDFINDTNKIKVSFDINPDAPKGPRADNVRRLDFPNQTV